MENDIQQITTAAKTLKERALNLIRSIQVKIATEQHDEIVIRIRRK